MCTKDDRFARNPDVMWKQLGSQIVTLNVKTHQYHVLNEAAALIFHRSTGDETVETIAQELDKQFKIGQTQAQQDVMETVEGMVKLGLLSGAEVRAVGYTRPMIGTITEEDFKGAIAGGAKLVCRSLLGGA